MTRIILTERSSDFHACIDGKPGLWGCGSTPAIAVGDVVMNHPAAFGIRIVAPWGERGAEPEAKPQGGAR